MILLAYAGFSVAQTIEDFESIKMNIFENGSTGSVTVVPNPDATGINTSMYVGKMVRAKDGKPWQGWYSIMATPVDMTANKYVHVKVWKPRISPTCFKFELGAGDSGDTFPITEVSETGKWVEVVFDYTANTKVTGDYVKIVFIPDFIDPVNLTEDIVIYFDDMYVNNDPTVGSAPVTLMENFELIPLTLLSDGNVDDQSSFTLVTNPDPTGNNLSGWVLDFKRDKDAANWTGFWSLLPTPVDVTTNHYAHVKLWKPRQSNAKFKLEGGTNGTKEFPSLHGTAELGVWQDIVFDINEFTGTYPKIGLLIDMDGEALTEDIHIYVDDIMVNNDPNPKGPPKQILQVDMNGATMVAGDRVWITGNFGGINGSWATPGDNPNNEMLDTDGDGIYTIELSVAPGNYEFKFFINAGWDPANPGKDPYNINRVATFEWDVNNIYTWGVGGFEVSVRDTKLAGKIQMYPNPVRNELTINSTTDISKVIITNTLGKVVGNMVYTNNKTVNTNNLSKGMYFVTFVNADGTKVTQKLIKE